VKSFDPNIHKIPIEQIRELIEQYIPLEMCRCYGLVPLSKNDGESPSILVGMINPDDLEALDRLNRVLPSQGLGIQRIAIASEYYQQLMHQLFEALDDAGESDSTLSLQDTEADPSAFEIVNKILAKALQEGVSDIHVEPQAEHLRIRFRKDGVLSQAFPPLPRKMIPAIVSHIKIKANLDIAERRKPQNGVVQYLFQGRRFDLRVSTLPSLFGEKIGVRLQACAASPLTLAQVMQNAEAHTLVKDLLQRKIGLILFWR
jgi:type IV pilus assembly protein PilB